MAYQYAKYASNNAGVFMLAFDNWSYWKEYKSQDFADNMLRTGNMQAYSTILNHMSGCVGACPDQWNAFINYTWPNVVR